MRALILLVALAGCSVGEARPKAPATPGTTAAVAEPGALYGLKLNALDGSAFDTAALKGKAVLFVNVASKCGYTNQYDGLQALYTARRDAGLEIVGVPCNQFAGQEPGSPEEIATFCRQNYGVTFPLLEKQDVNGPDRSALYAMLIGSGDNIGWNFEKFVVNRKGEVVGRFSSKVKPDDPALLAAIDQALAN